MSPSVTIRRRFLVSVLPRALALSALATFGPGASLAQPAPPPPLTTTAARHFVDRVFPRDLAADHVPGAAVVIVKGGKILLARGYGYANRARRTAVSTARTAFGLGPVSVVFTTVAVMQLAERHKLSLTADVNRYLRPAAGHGGYIVPGTFARPVTLQNLLTNTAGFGDSHIDRMALSAGQLQPLGPFLGANMPPRIHPPGAEPSYSTFGFTLAGYVVQLAAHQPFAAYVERHVFRPLGMDHSSFQQPLPGHLRHDLVTGYDVGSNGAAQPAPSDYFNVFPGDGTVATPADVAHFLIALLSGGAYDRHRILAAGTVRDMEKQHFSPYPPLVPSRSRGRAPASVPSLPAEAYGLDRVPQAGRLAIQEAGVIRGFSSLLAVFPRQRVGLFVATTSASDAPEFLLERQIIDHFFPRPASSRLTPPASGGDGIGRFAGTYWSDDYAPNTIEKLRQLPNQVTVSVTGPERLTAHFWSGGTTRLTRVGRGLFQSGSGVNATYWFFHTDRSGRVDWMVPGGNQAYDRVSWYETTDVQLGLIAALLAMCASGCVVWLLMPAARWLRRRGDRRGSPGGRAAGPLGSRNFGARVGGGRWTDLATWLAASTSALILFFLVTVGVVMESAIATQNEHYSWLEYGIPGWVTALLAVPLVILPLVAALLVLAVAAWSNAWWPVWRRLHFTLIALAGVFLFPFLASWNLLGFQY